MIDKEFLTFSEKPRELPTVALRGLVVFPDMFIHFEVGREKSINALKEAMDGGQEVFLVAQRDVSVDDPDYDELYDIGVIAKVKQLIRMPGKNTNIRVAVEGIARARLIGGVAGKNSKCLRSLIVPVSELPRSCAIIQERSSVTPKSSLPTMSRLRRRCPLISSPALCRSPSRASLPTMLRAIL